MSGLCFCGDMFSGPFVENLRVSHRGVGGVVHVYYNVCNDCGREVSDVLRNKKEVYRFRKAVDKQLSSV